MLERRKRLRVLGLDSELAGLGAGGRHHRVHARQNVRRKMLHELGVLMDERLALGAVGDHVLHPRLRLDICREAGPAGAHHAALAQFLAEHQSKDTSCSARFPLAPAVL